jgi:GDP-L-fucose synthase
VEDPSAAVGSLTVTVFSPGELAREAPIYVAGHQGLAGSAIVRRLQAAGFENIIGRTSAELDLRDRELVIEFLDSVKPRYLVLAAAKVGGILANNTFPVDFLSDNLRIQLNVMDGARHIGVERLLFLGSSCIYPKLAEQPILEESLLCGPLEPTNDAYAIAKIAGIMHVQAVRRQFGLPWISAMPTNLYGPNDNFSLSGSHVLPALIRRYDEAATSGAVSVTNWGTGAPRRDFLHVDDMADACLHLLEHYDSSEHVNVGSGTDVPSKSWQRQFQMSWATPVKHIGTQPNLTELRRNCSMCPNLRRLAGPRGLVCERELRARSSGTALIWNLRELAPERGST